MKFSFKRSDDEKLLNVGEPFKVGGCGKTEKKEIEIREPSIRVIANMVKRVVVMLSGLAEDEQEWVDRVVSKPQSITPSDLSTFMPIVNLLEAEIARVVGEDVDYVRDEMSPGQAMEVGARWLKVVGFERIRDLFLAIKGEFSKLMPDPDRNTESAIDEPLSATH